MIPEDDLEWYRLLKRIRRGGWTNANLRQFGRALMPRLRWERPFYGVSRPPDAPSRSTDLIDFELTFHTVRSEDIEIPDEMLSRVVACWREALLHAVSFLNDIEPAAWETPTLIAEEGPGERYYNDVGGFLLRFAELFDRLVDNAPSAGQREIERWPTGEPFFFDKLRTWVARRSELLDISSAEEIVLGLDDDAFWGPRRARELLWTLSARWSGLTEDGRRAIEDRIIAGPSRWDHEDSNEYDKRRAREAATRLGWLVLQGQELSAIATKKLPELRAADARWRPEWDAHAAGSLEGRSGLVRPDLNPGELPSLPLAQIASEALAAEGRRDDQFVSPEPFRGLLETRPARALAALTHEGRQGRYPLRLWTTLLDQREPTHPQRLTRAIAGRLAKLPQPVLVELRFSSSRWLERVSGAPGPRGVESY